MAVEKYVVSHAALSDIGLKRSRNEDSIGFIEIEDGYVFVVCDGMGGHEGGEIASKTAVRSIIEYLNTTKIENVSVALHQAITYANKQIYTTALSRPDLKGMGTTAVVLLIYKDEIYTAHVGDSRIYVLTDKQFIQISKDHSVVQEMVDNGILKPEEAENHPRKNEITRALGVKQEVLPAISNKVLKAKAGDRFVICSDGLHGLISTLVFSATVQQYTNPDECANKLIALAKEGGGDDNISVQIIDITESPFTESLYPTLLHQPIKLEINTQVIEKEKKFPTKQVAIISGLLIVASIIFGVYKFGKPEKETDIEINNARKMADSTSKVIDISNVQPLSNDENKKELEKKELEKRRNQKAEINESKKNKPIQNKNQQTPFDSAATTIETVK